MINKYVDKILEEFLITEFLEERGIYPSRTTGDKWVYLCPIHSGDKDPSFVVYPAGTAGRNYQTYHCFGCHSGINIINLKSELDNISTLAATKSFLTDVEIDEKSVMESIISDFKKKGATKDDDNEVERLLLMINSICRDHLETCNDDEEIEFMDNVFFRNLDRYAIANDGDALMRIYSIIMDRGGLEERVKMFNDRMEERRMKSMEWII